MTDKKLWGYMGKILRVNLTNGSIQDEALSPEMAESYLGGSGFGVEYLYREVPPGVTWDDPENRIIMASGPMGGTHLAGSGTFSLVTKGPMTNLGVSTQANGFWGAFLKFAGYDGVVIHGQSPRWVYLHIGDGKVELRDASPILGKDTWEMEDAVRQDLGATQRTSVFGIGPSGENKVRFAAVAGDKGHFCSKNGCGCVMGSKRLKAVAVTSGPQSVPVYKKELLREKANALLEAAKKNKGGQFYKWGTGGTFSSHALAGSLPIRNYTTNLFPEHEKMNAEYIRTHFEHRNKPCWACGLVHTKFMKVTEGPYTGYEGEEPEYECMAAWGPVIGNTDPGAMVMLSNVTDRLGLDTNEAGWVIAWVMECYEKGIFTQKDLDGLDMRWGNVEATKTMLEKITKREGIGNLLAEGVKRASEEIGGEAPKMGVYTLRGATPRGHDHRARWAEMLETCVSATSTIQSSSTLTSPTYFGSPPATNSFSPWEVAGASAKVEGWFVFLDTLGVCRFITIDPGLSMECVNAATGRDFTLSDALTMGRRIINQLRVFNFRHGLDPALEAPSPRYGSTPTDGPTQGKSIGPYFQWMKSFYFELMGWDPATGRPLPHTLRSLGLEKLIPDLET
ncbi:MAG: aldehyde ferredoxin oxidoreductase C-terminal domain-containing protein [Thermodesulfobacteriota bacterium]|nr:aldehyde ferredoxin oxidoreductase C-terminal domain-containing protein [Thermodesulfobacteriota bacterium]